MILKRPERRGGGISRRRQIPPGKDPEGRVAGALESAGGRGSDAPDAETQSGDDTFPLTVNIGHPVLTGDALVRDHAEIRDWIAAWTSLRETAPVAFETRRRRRIGRVDLPAHLAFDSIDDLARSPGARHLGELKPGRKSVAALAGIDARIKAMAPHWRRLATLPIEERDGFARFLDACKHGLRAPGEAALTDIRELAVAGLDTKWVETRQNNGPRRARPYRLPARGRYAARAARIPR